MKTYRHTLPTNGLIDDRYRIQGVLGEGGFGITYRVWDERLERLVVIKEYLPGDLGVRDSDTLMVIPREQREDQFQYGLNKYLDEAKALAKFQHPNIVRIIDHLETHGTAYIVMEYEEGETLTEQLKRRSNLMSEGEILALIVPLLQGLLKVHDAGLLHRDIKPGNIFIRESGDPLLIDFGAARHALGGQSKSVSAIVTGGYAPPEQYTTRGKQGPHTDLYAIGAVLYELISGATALESVERSHTISDGEGDPLTPAVQVGQGRISEWLLHLVDRLLHLPSKERPQGCAEVLAEIQAHHQGQGPVVREARDEPQKTRMVREEERFDDPLPASSPPKRRRKVTNVWPAAVMVVLLLVGGTTFFLSGDRTPIPNAAKADKSDVAEEAPKLEGDEPSQLEADHYIIATEINTVYAYQLFLRKYPNGPFTEEARARFNR